MTTTIKWVRSKNGNYASECGRFVIIRHHPCSKYGAFCVTDQHTTDPVTPQYNMQRNGTLRSCKAQAERWLRGRN